MCIPIVFLNVHVFGYCILNQNNKAILANNTAHASYCTGKIISVQLLLQSNQYRKMNIKYVYPANFYHCFICSSSAAAADGKSVSLCSPLYTPAAIIPPIMGALP